MAFDQTLVLIGRRAGRTGLATCKDCRRVLRRVRPPKLELQLFLTVLAFVLDTEVGAGRHVDALAGHWIS